MQTFKKLPISKPSTKTRKEIYIIIAGPSHIKSSIGIILPSHNIPVKKIISNAIYLFKQIGIRILLKIYKQFVHKLFLFRNLSNEFQNTTRYQETRST